MKLYKNSFLKFIFVNLIIVNIRSINDNEVENNELFACPEIRDNYMNASLNAQCKRLQQLFAMLNKKENYEIKNHESLNRYSDISAEINHNLLYTRFDLFLEYIKKDGDEKTKQFFMVLKENKKGEETKRE